MNTPKAQIVLATYNGEVFLSQQLKSLQAQVEKNWKCFIRDDGSQDGTLKIIESFSHSDKRFVLLPLDGMRLGPQQGFSKLLASCSPEAPVFYCDQDDLWHPNKLSIMLQYFTKAPLKKLLLASDLRIIKQDSTLICDSMMKKLNYDPQNSSLLTLLGQNIFPGCAMAFSGSLLADIYPIPKEACMHDWWSALIALSYGELNFLKTPLVYYRQHSAQASGGLASASFYKKIVDAFSGKEKNLRNIMKMRFTLWLLLGKRLKGIPSNNHDATEFSNWISSMERLNRWQCLLGVLKMKIRTQGLLRMLVFCFGLLLYFADFKDLKSKHFS